MEKYDYRKAVNADIREFINDNLDLESIKEDYNNMEHFYECLFDDLFLEDSVTGNVSGSYTMSRWQAEENLCHNFDLIQEAIEEDWGEQPNWSNPEVIDVELRCYLLRSELWKICCELWGEE